MADSNDFPSQAWVTAKTQNNKLPMTGFNMFIIWSFEKGNKNLPIVSKNWRELPQDIKDRWNRLMDQHNSKCLVPMQTAEESTDSEDNSRDQESEDQESEDS